MKKLVVLALLLVVVVAAGAPYVVGSVVKSQIEEFVDEVNSESLFAGYSLENYEKGWFSSKATLIFDPLDMMRSWELDEAYLPEYIGFRIPFDLEISHGPYAPAGLASYSITPQDDEILRDFIAWSDFKPFVSLTGTVSYSGDVDFLALMEPFLVTIERDYQEVNFAGVRIEGTIDDGFVHSEAMLEGMEYIDSRTGTNVQVGPLALSVASEFILSPSALYDAEFSANLEQISVAGITQFSISDMVYTSTVEMNEERTDADIGMNLTISEVAVYEEPQLSDFSLEMEIRNYSSEFHEAYWDTSFASMKYPDPAQGFEETMASMKQALVHLLSAGPEFEVKHLTFASPKGNFDGGGKFVFNSAKRDFSPVELYDINFEILLRNQNVVVQDIEVISISDLVYSGYVELNEDASKADMGINVSLGSLKSGGLIPEVDIEDLQLDVEYRNYSAEAHIAYMEQLIPVVAAVQLGAQLNPDLEEVGTLILKAGPELEIKRAMIVSPTFGNFDGSAQLVIEPLELSPAELQNPLSILPYVEAELAAAFNDAAFRTVIEQQARTAIEAANLNDGSFSEEQLEALIQTQIDQQIFGILSLGFLVEEEDGYSISASFKDGAAELNGNPVPLPF